MCFAAVESKGEGHGEETELSGIAVGCGGDLGIVVLIHATGWRRMRRNYDMGWFLRAGSVGSFCLWHVFLPVPLRSSRNLVFFAVVAFYEFVRVFVTNEAFGLAVS